MWEIDTGGNTHHYNIMTSVDNQFKYTTYEGSSNRAIKQTNLVILVLILLVFSVVSLNQSMACITVEQLAIRKHHGMFIQIGNCECVMDKLISSDLLRIVYLDRVKSDQDSKTFNR